MLTWFRCPSQLCMHPRLFDAGADACLLYVALRGWQNLKEGARFCEADLSPTTLSRMSQLSPKRAARALTALQVRAILVPDDCRTWAICELVSFQDSAVRVRKHRECAVTRNVTLARDARSDSDQIQIRSRSEEEASAHDGACAREEARPTDATGSADPTDPAGLQAVEYSDDECMAIAVRTAEYAAELFGLPGTASERALSAIAGSARAGLSEEALQNVAYAFRWQPWYQKDSPRVRPAALETMYGRGVEKARSWSAEGRALRAQHEAAAAERRDADDRRRRLRAEHEAQVAEARVAAAAGDEEAARWLAYNGISLVAEADEADESQVPESAFRAVG